MLFWGKSVDCVRTRIDVDSGQGSGSGPVEMSRNISLFNWKYVSSELRGFFVFFFTSKVARQVSLKTPVTVWKVSEVVCWDFSCCWQLASRVSSWLRWTAVFLLRLNKRWYFWLLLLRIFEVLLLWLECKPFLYLSSSLSALNTVA